MLLRENRRSRSSTSSTSSTRRIQNECFDTNRVCLLAGVAGVAFPLSALQCLSDLKLAIFKTVDTLCNFYCNDDNDDNDDNDTTIAELVYMYASL